MNKSITFNRSEQLAADIDRLTARLLEIVEMKEDLPKVRASAICEIAIIAVWSHERRPRAKAALDRFMKAMEQIQ